MPDSCDLVIHARRIFCPRQGWLQGKIAVRNGRIAAVGQADGFHSLRHLAFPDAILLPGLIDLHAHPARCSSQFGVDPDPHFLERGTTTVLSQGDAGGDNLAEYFRETILPSRTRVRLALNIGATGETGPAGSCSRLDQVDVARCVAAAKRYHPHVWGIAVNASRNTCGLSDPHEVLRRGLQAATETGLPMLYGMRSPDDWSLAEQLRHLRPGDVVTYCYRRTPHCIVENRRVLPEIREARDRGVLFDVGHGRASFDFSVAEDAIADGFPPDTISTDLQRAHVGEKPVHDLPLVMSKLQAAGMSESDLFSAVTFRPAAILGLVDEIGSLTIGSCADLTILRESSPAQPLVDTTGNSRIGKRWDVVATIRGGELVGSYAR